MVGTRGEDLVISEEHVQRAAGRFRLVLQPEHELEDRAIVRPPPDQIAHLDDDQAAADPRIARIRRAGEAKSAARGLDVRVQIADGDEPLRLLSVPVRAGSGHPARPGRERDGDGTGNGQRKEDADQRYRHLLTSIGALGNPMAR